ncbi:MAG TPA: putative toxin-antitoxin system toxin component, PIN family [Pyrinomonadaceae bacterium]|nr:putative toxin-antitoxin system toxin component, PIN family [Pyrinomonadaceae bacterium]
MVVGKKKRLRLCGATARNGTVLVPPRKHRTQIVFDTNVLVGFYLSRSPASANQQAFRLWRDQRRIQLIISDEVLQEYLEVLARLRIPLPLIERLEERLTRRSTVTRVRLGSRPKVSRDPDDNVIIATARSGKAEFVVTNDRDLLEILASEQARLRLRIVTPREFIAIIKAGG